MSKITSKKVSMAELFYDLIYVLAVQKATGMIHHLHNGQISAYIYLKFIVVCTIILLLWFNQTIYINKYGTNSYYDIIGMFIHMFGAIYVSNNISLKWSKAFVPFNVSAIVMTLSIILQYYLRSREYDKMPLEIKNQIMILFFEICALIIALILGPKYGLIIGPIAYFSAMFSPVLIMPKNNSEITLNFPHLVERVSLITIIIFGEMVVGLAGMFTFENLEIWALTIFMSVAFLFGSYVLQIEKIINHYQITRGFTMVYAHIGIFMGLSTITASFGFVIEDNVNWKFLIFFRMLGLIIFYVSMFAISVYGKDEYKLKLKDILAYSVIFVMGGIITALSNKGQVLLFSFGMFVMTLLIFLYMFNIAKKRRLV